MIMLVYGLAAELATAVVLAAIMTPRVIEKRLLSGVFVRQLI
jgi:hypothetical protein